MAIITNVFGQKILNALYVHQDIGDDLDGQIHPPTGKVFVSRLYADGSYEHEPFNYDLAAACAGA